MLLERSPSRNEPGVLDAQPADVPCCASPLRQLDREQGSFWASQLLNVERCDDQLNPPHHLRVIGRPARPIGAIRAIERLQVHLLDRAEHRPHQVILGDPIRQRRRQQHLLAAVT
jgi:hypothetical protein